MSTKANICRECKFYVAINTCKHPDLVDVVTGQPSDCYEQRCEVATDHPHYGYAGNLWQPRPGLAREASSGAAANGAKAVGAAPHA